MFFRLLRHCRLVEGACRAAIYNMYNGKVISVNGSAADLINACQTRSVEDVLADLPNPAVFQNFLNNLVERELGAYHICQPAPHPETERSQEPALDFLWLELTAKCNNRCLHCYSESHMNCEESMVDHARWLSLLEEARTAGASGVQLIGGEPLLYPDWRELVNKAAELKYDYIEIFTNATLIREADIEFFKQRSVRIATTIYADNAAIHDAVTKNPGSFERTLSAARKLVTAGIPLRIASILMKVNEAEAENIMRLCAELGVEYGPPDVVRPTGRGDDQDLLPVNHHRAPVSPPFFTDPESFTRSKHCNACLAGKIAVTASGDVIPCIFARSMICGNILQTPLQAIINGEALRNCWLSTRDCVEKCKDCEYRYCCHDCRPLAQSSDPSRNWLAPSPGCSYNPYIGKWEDSTNG